MKLHRPFQGVLREAFGRYARGWFPVQRPQIRVTAPCSAALNPAALDRARGVVCTNRGHVPLAAPATCAR